MTSSPEAKKSVLMMAYTYYEVDPRVIREAEAAVSGGFDVDFLALRRPGDPPEEMVRGVRVIHVNQAKYRGKNSISYLLTYLTFFWHCFVHATNLFFEKRYSVIHVNNMPDFLVFSTLIPKLCGAKIILDIHDPMPNTFASKFKGGENGFFYRILLWQEQLSAAYSDCVVTVHEPVKEGILLKHGLAPESIEVIANFADEALFPLQESFNADDKVLCVFHGTILERSGLGTFMTALAGVRHKDRIRAKIIGEGDFSKALRDLIRSLHLEEMVEFDNHSYPVHSIAKRLEGCTLGVIPLEISSVTNYALPLKLLEYISMGLPSVTVRSYAISYYFDESDCLFFDWDDPSSLSAVLDRVAENPELLRQYHERAVSLRDKFGWSREKKKYVELLRRLSATNRSA